jgi:hypothetical protein
VLRHGTSVDSSTHVGFAQPHVLTYFSAVQASHCPNVFFCIFETADGVNHRPLNTVHFRHFRETHIVRGRHAAAVLWLVRAAEATQDTHPLLQLQLRLSHGTSGASIQAVQPLSQHHQAMLQVGVYESFCELGTVCAAERTSAVMQQSPTPVNGELPLALQLYHHNRNAGRWMCRRSDIQFKDTDTMFEVETSDPPHAR